MTIKIVSVWVMLAATDNNKATGQQIVVTSHNKPPADAKVV